jgi:putative nucleotidyltransferase with HDIG domain
METSSLLETSSLRDEILAKAETARVLPTLNTIIGELFRVMDDRNGSFHQIFNIVRYDQAITSKIISIANSAYYNRGARVGNLERAMILIGFEQIKNIVMCLVCLKEILNQWKLSQHDLAELWTHSLQVACAARTLGDKTMAEEPEKAFTASILHDIGKVVFYTFGDQYRKVLEEARKGVKEIHVLEKEVFGVDHQEVGYLVSVKWRFPEEFSAVIRGHHGRKEGKNVLLDLVRVADAFIDGPAADLGAEGIILQGEKERILKEAGRVSELLGVTDAGR